MAFVGSSIIAAEQSVTTEIFNVTIALANTEQSLLLSSGTIVGYLIRSRDADELKLSHVATESGTKYVTIPKRATFTDDHTYTNLTLYFQSPVAGGVVEVIAFKV
jgi:hypothetical protein